MQIAPVKSEVTAKVSYEVHHKVLLAAHAEVASKVEEAVRKC